MREGGEGRDLKVYGTRHSDKVGECKYIPIKRLSWNTYNKVWASQKINITSARFCLCRVDSSRVDDNSTCDLAHGEGSALYIKVNVFECDYYITFLFFYLSQC